MQYVRVKAGIPGFLVGNHFVTRDDGPFPMADDLKAREWIRLGIVEACAPIEPIAEVREERPRPKPPKVERATLGR